MFFIRRPSPDAIDRFIDRSRVLPLSYSASDPSDPRDSGMDVDESVTTIGHGEADFERARSALTGWKQYGMGWVELFPHGASIEPGTVVAVLIRHFGFWSLNGARVVYRTGDRRRGHHFGVAYATLPNHAERGEELFEVSLHPDSGAVTYRIHAVSAPRAILTRAGYPIVRWLQARFRRDSAAAMKRATSAG